MNSIGEAVETAAERESFSTRLARLKQKKLLPTLRAAFSAEVPVLHWWRGKPNWGDALNPVLVRNITGKVPVAVDDIVNLADRPVYTAIGSVLDRARYENLEVWGSGFIRPNPQAVKKPRHVHAVRGPLTKGIFERLGIRCPDVYGDPALLLPRYYDPRIEKRYALGLIPHYVDQDSSLLNALCVRPDVLMIDILGGITQVVDQILQCSLIASSSLHGLIAADAYGVPAVWITLSNRVIGGEFKFHDYFLGANRWVQPALEVTPQTTMQQICDRYVPYKIDPDLDRLLDACPFR